MERVCFLLKVKPDRLERIVWMGGAIAEGNITPAAEFNAFVDPEAAAAVLASGIPITMVGLDVTHRALFTRAHAERLRGAGRAGRFVAELSDFFQLFHERSYRFDGSPIHDAMAVAHVIDPTLLTTRPVNVAVETRSEFCDGRTVVDLRGVTGREPNAKVGLGIFTLVSADFELSNATGFTFASSWNFLGAFKGRLKGTVGNGVVSADATGTVLGQTVELKGDVRDGGRTYDLLGDADVHVGPLDLTKVRFELSSAKGFTFSHDWNFLGVFSGSVDATIGKEGAEDLWGFSCSGACGTLVLVDS